MILNRLQSYEKFLTFANIFTFLCKAGNNCHSGQGGYSLPDTAAGSLRAILFRQNRSDEIAELDNGIRVADLGAPGGIEFGVTRMTAVVLDELRLTAGIAPLFRLPLLRRRTR